MSFSEQHNCGPACEPPQERPRFDRSLYRSPFDAVTASLTAPRRVDADRARDTMPLESLDFSSYQGCRLTERAG